MWERWSFPHTSQANRRDLEAPPRPRASSDTLQHPPCARRGPPHQGRAGWSVARRRASHADGHEEMEASMDAGRLLRRSSSRRTPFCALGHAYRRGFAKVWGRQPHPTMRTREAASHRRPPISCPARSIDDWRHDWIGQSTRIALVNHN